MFGGFHYANFLDPADERATTSFASGTFTHRKNVTGGRKVILGEVAARL